MHLGRSVEGLSSIAGVLRQLPVVCCASVFHLHRATDFLQGEQKHQRPKFFHLPTHLNCTVSLYWNAIALQPLIRLHPSGN